MEDLLGRGVEHIDGLAGGDGGQRSALDGQRHGAGLEQHGHEAVAGDDAGLGDIGRLEDDAAAALADQLLADELAQIGIAAGVGGGERDRGQLEIGFGQHSAGGFGSDEAGQGGQQLDGAGEIDRLVDAGDHEARGEAATGGGVAKAEEVGRFGDGLGVEAHIGDVEAHIGADTIGDDAAAREVGFDQAVEHGLVDQRRVAHDANAGEADILEIGEADQLGGVLDIGERHDAGGAGGRSEEDRCLGERAGIVEHVADGDDRLVDGDVALEGGRRERGAGREQRQDQSEGQEFHHHSPQRSWLVACSISSAPEMTRAFIS